MSEKFKNIIFDALKVIILLFIIGAIVLIVLRNYTDNIGLLQYEPVTIAQPSFAVTSEAKKFDTSSNVQENTVHKEINVCGGTSQMAGKIEGDIFGVKEIQIILISVSGKKHVQKADINTNDSSFVATGWLQSGTYTYQVYVIPNHGDAYSIYKGKVVVPPCT